MTRYIYFDDELDQATELAAALKTQDLDVEASLPPQSLTGASQPDVDGYLVDYDLSVHNAGRSPIGYRGGTLATVLREGDRALPMVLVTGKPREQDKGADRLLDELPVFDAVIFKGDIGSQARSISERLMLVANGFAELRAAEKTWAGLLEALRPPSPNDVALLREIPPTDKGADWSVPVVARWLERIMLRFPGVLLDPLHASAMLGLDISALEDHTVRDLLTPAEYLGPFAPSEGRWWKESLIEIAVSLLPREQRIPLFRHFATSISELLGQTIPRSRCIDCGELADSVCYVLHRPVLTEHSLLYYPDQRPSVMDAARVSFEAIIHSNDVRDELIDVNSGDLVAATRATAHATL